MTPDEYTPLYCKYKREYTEKQDAVKLRQDLLKQQYDSSINSNKKDYKLDDIDNKLQKIDKEEDSATLYYKREIEKAEERYDNIKESFMNDILRAEEKLRDLKKSKEEEIAKAEEKLRTYRQYCMETIERITDKFDIKRSSLELKKNVTDISFDDYMLSDIVLNKLKLELVVAKDTLGRADINMAEYESQEKKNKETERRNRAFLEQQERTIAEARAKAAERDAEEARYDNFVEQGGDQKDVNKEIEDARVKREEENIILNRRLYAQRVELKKVWTAKQEKKYQKLPKDDRIGFLDLSIEAVLNHLN